MNISQIFLKNFCLKDFIFNNDIYYATQLYYIRANKIIYMDTCTFTCYTVYIFILYIITLYNIQL